MNVTLHYVHVDFILTYSTKVANFSPFRPFGIPGVRHFDPFFVRHSGRSAFRPLPHHPPVEWHCDLRTPRVLLFSAFPYFVIGFVLDTWNLHYCKRQFPILFLWYCSGSLFNIYIYIYRTFKGRLAREEISDSRMVLATDLSERLKRACQSTSTVVINTESYRELPKYTESCREQSQWLDSKWW